MCQVWWLMPIIPAFGRLIQEDEEFKANLARLWLQKK
jgi:hypothetical protein